MNGWGYSQKTVIIEDEKWMAEGFVRKLLPEGTKNA